VIVALDEVPPCCARQAIGLGDGDGDAIGDGVGEGDGVGSAGGEALEAAVGEGEEPPAEGEPQAVSKMMTAARVVAAGARMRTRVGPASSVEQGR
jgi:hypothetical protein